MKRIVKVWLALLLVISMTFTGCSTAVTILNEVVNEIANQEGGSGGSSQTAAGKSEAVTPAAPAPVTETLDKNGSYTSKEEVALYIHLYGKLPDNYISKKDAEKLGWNSSKGNLWDVAPGKSIGGSKFGNYEGLLPAADGRTYQECDIDYEGGYRNSKRIVFSNDGLVYYTEDHYTTFELLYE